MSEVKSQSMKASSEKFTTKASSWGFEARIRSSALLLTEGRLRYMEPELSTTRPIETGRSVCWKLMRVCLTPSSKTWKSSLVRFSTRSAAVEHGGIEDHFFHVGVEQVAFALLFQRTGGGPAPRRRASGRDRCHSERTAPALPACRKPGRSGRRGLLRGQRERQPQPGMRQRPRYCKGA